MTFKFKFAAVIQNARTEQGYTQSEVAEASSISLRWYQRIEAGIKLPSLTVALRILLFLHIGIEEFREEVGLVVPVHSSARRIKVR